MTVPPSLSNSLNPDAPHGVRVRTARRSFEDGSLFLTFLDGHDPDEGLVAAGLARRDDPDGGGFITFGERGERAWVKGGRLTKKSALRHGAAAFFARRPLPRAAEFNNLTWLLLSGFAAARPLVAGALFDRRGLPRAQFLATLEIKGVCDLHGFLKDPSRSNDERRTALVSAGTLAADLHLAGFEHRDFFARNLVRDTHGDLSLLDAWSGGPGTSARFSMRDVAGFLADAQDLLRTDESRLFLEAYSNRAKGAIELPASGRIKTAIQKAHVRSAKRSRRRK